MPERYSAVFLLSRLQSELNRLFQDFMHVGESAIEEGTLSPKIDVVEGEDAMVLLAEVPGMASSELKIEVTGNLVTLSGVKKTPPPTATGVKFHRVERGHGRFVRHVQLLRPVNGRRAEAWLARGLLTVSLPKIEDKRRRALEVAIREAEDERP